ncbi:MAG: MFS transporter [Deltaproteobacteria bacterium]|nr:MFS transporter [Deltaproteobacteria bacterium]
MTLKRVVIPNEVRDLYRTEPLPTGHRDRSLAEKIQRPLLRLALGAGLHSFGFTIFFLPLSQDLNLSRTATSFAFSLARAEGAIEGPIVGHVLDRYGPRPVMLTAVLLMGVGYLLLSTVESYAMFLVVYIGVISLAHSGGFMHAPMVLTNSWFIRKRARAITVNSASFSLGGVLIAPVLSAIVLSWGWRWGAAFAGVMFLLIGVPLSSTIRRSPESMGLLPDGDIPSASAEDQKNEPQRRAPAEVDVTTGEAFRSFTFWTLVLGNAIRNMSYHAIATHFVPLMVWKGMSQPQAAFLLSSFAFLGMTTTLLLGWFADRVNKPRLVAGILFVAAGGMLLPVFGSSMWLLLLFTLLFTAVESTYAIGWAVVGDFFGRKHFAKIRGYMSFFYMWGGVAGPVIAGAIYDRWQTYEPMLWALVLLFALSGAIFGMLIKRWEKLRAQMTPRIDNDV